MIYYEAGARGDFLANAIADGNKLDNKKCEKDLYLSKYYAKIHKYSWGAGWEYWPIGRRTARILPSVNAIFAQAKKEQLITIRILADNFADCLDIAYMHYEKNEPLVQIDKISAYTAFGIAWRESADLLQRHRYNHVIKFTNLFDIEYIKNFYFEINKQPITDEHCTRLIENINKQTIFSKTDRGQAVLNDITQLHKTHKYSDIDLYFRQSNEID